MEIYSKRSALGCPVPIFIAAWQIIALAPAAINSLLFLFIIVELGSPESQAAVQ